jgi:transcriptional regulator with XRE-family HTH domain
MQDIYRKVGVQVRARREQLGWTQEELGEASGLHPSFIGQIERGVKKTSLQTLALLAGALGISLGALLDEAPCSLSQNWETRIGALLRDKSSHQKEILYSTLRHLSRELRGGK